MPNKPDVLCSGGCGQLLWRGTGSAADPMCRKCRSKFRVCAYEKCAREFKAKDKKTKFCSRACAAANRKMYENPRMGSKASTRARTLRHTETWDGVEDGTIFERDGWQCQIPGCELGPIRQDLKKPEPLSPSIDHIVPISRGGADTALNKRAAHLGCNRRRNNKMLPDDASIITPEMTPVGLLLDRRRRSDKPIVYCTVCGIVPVKKSAMCRSCWQADKNKVSEIIRPQILLCREQGMKWKDIAAKFGLSGPGAASNIAYPPDWDKYAG